MTQTAALQRQQQPQTLKNLLHDPLYQKRFEELLGKRSAQFVSSVLSVGMTLGHDCEPVSIITSAMTAATLDLPVDKNLGFAWIVPYKEQGKKKAQFQMGYKGYIQLGLRTGQYERMNARVINAEAFHGWDEVGEPIIDWSKIDESRPSVGYVFAFKLVNGFTKIAFWPKERVEAHAKRYSKSYGGNYSSPWKSDFDAMALKTVIKNELAKWGILSIEMVTAIKHDQGTQDALDTDPHYLDGTDLNGNGEIAAVGPEVISEEQRAEIVTLANQHGVVEKLGVIVNEAGFEMLAHITVDKYGEILDAIANQTPESSIPSIHIEPTDTDEGAQQALIEADEAEQIDAEESKRQALVDSAKDRIREITGGKSRETAEILHGRTLDGMNMRALKAFHKELDQIEAAA